MTRREFVLLLAAAANEQSRALIRSLYAQPQRGERRAKLAPPPTVTPDKSTKIRRKGRAVATKNRLT